MNLKELREKHKLSQAALGSALGVSGKSIYLIESGRMKLSKKLSDKIAEVYGEVVELAGKEAEKVAADAAQALVDTEKKVDKRKRKTTARIKAEKPAIEAVAEALAAPVEEAKALKPEKQAKAHTMKLVIQSPYGAEITPEEIRERIGEADAVYVRVDQNKAYWVKGEKTGSIDLF